MHISAIDAPSDMYGAVSDVARPLIHKLNQASMSSSTYEALYTLLLWATAQLENNIRLDLEHFQGHPQVAQSNETTESTKDETSADGQGNDIDPNANPAQEPETSAPEDLVPAEPKSTAETTIVNGIEVKVLTAAMLEGDEDEDEDEVPAPAPVEPEVVAPAVEAPKVLTNPAAKSKAK